MRKTTRKKALFIGNGINRIGGNNGYEHSLEELLMRLRDFSDPEIKLDNELKPFPLSFEEILARKNNSYTEGQKILKKAIAKKFGEMRPNEVHNSCVNSNVKHIVTTNYDYCFELALQSDFKPKNIKSTKEFIHSLERNYSFLDHEKTIWHINGELDSYVSPTNKRYNSHDSILIGYDQYCSYLKKMQDTAYVPAENKLTLQKRMGKYQKEGVDGISYWTDLFFTHDIVIMGFGFDFSEIHLWWLLSYRNRLFKDGRIDILERNKIKYYYKKQDEEKKCDCEKHIRDKKLSATTAVLDALGIKTIGVECEDYKALYEHVLKTEDLI